MTRSIRFVGVVGLLLLCFGFEWPGRVVRLTAQLRSDDVAERREAARLLGEHRAEDARGGLLIALDDDDPSVRREAIAAAAKVGLRDHVPVLIDWLNDPAADTRAAAVEALGVLRELRAESALTRALGDGDAPVRAAAARALGRLGSAAAVTPLLGRLDDPDPVARAEAVNALGVLRDPRSLIPLTGRTQDPAVEVRVAALRVLGDLRDARALPALVRSLDDDSEVARLAATAAIGALGQTAAIEPLRARLAGADGRSGRAVLAALSAIGTEPAERLIVDQLGKPELSHGAVDVLVERVRRVRELDPAAAVAVVGLLTRALTETGDAARASAIEDALIRCSRHVSIRAALPTLLEAFQTRRGTLAMASLALAATGDESVLMPLLEALDGAQPDEQLALLRALDVLTLSIAADGRAADPLGAALSHAQPEAIVLVVRLLGRSRAPRALTSLVGLLAHARQEIQLSAIDAIGEIGAAESTSTLLPLLSDRRGAVRNAAIIALGRVLDITQSIARLDEIGTGTDAKNVALLTAVVAALTRLNSVNPPDSAQLTLLHAKLAPLVADEDEAIAALAVTGLSTLKTSDASNVIATVLRSPNASRRAHAARALGNFDDPRVRHVLRFVMTHDQVDVSVAAATALGQSGEGEDAQSLAKLARRYHWPFPAAASYAIALIARRGLLKPIASQAMLCELGRSREPIVRANVAIAMAQLGVGACEGGPDPFVWLTPEHTPQVRAAAARWLYAAVNAQRIDRARGLSALMECAARDAEPRVADACAGPSLPPLTAAIRQVVHDPEGREVLRHRLLALELGDGSVFVGHTDALGQLSVAPTPAMRLSGEQAIVSDPGLLPLEPTEAAPPAAPSAVDPPHPAAPPVPQP